MASKSSSGSARFKEGDTVLAYHGERIYDGKVEKVNDTGSSVMYFVHYAGWNRKWDEWLTGDRILEKNEENQAFAARINEDRQPSGGDVVHGAGSKAAADSASSSSRNKKDATSASRSKTSAKVSGLASPSAKGSSGATEDAAGGSGAGAASTPAAAAGKKRKADGTVVKDAEFEVSDTGLRFIFTFPMKRQLVEDWENVTNRSMLVRIPKENNMHTVTSILHAFVVSTHQATSGAPPMSKSSKRFKDSMEAVVAVAAAPLNMSSIEGIENTYKANVTLGLSPRARVVNDVLEGLRMYFDRCLPIFLLYRFERVQFESFARERGEDSLGPSTVYGAEHLLRLFVKLPQVLSQVTLGKEEGETLVTVVNDLLRFITKHASILFSPEHYVRASPEYIAAVTSATSAVLPRIPFAATMEARAPGA